MSFGTFVVPKNRITAVADVYDALSTKRIYKDAFPRQKCFEILNEQRGQKFAPRVWDAFFARSEDIIAIQMELIDPCPPDRSYVVRQFNGTDR